MQDDNKRTVTVASETIGTLSSLLVEARAASRAGAYRLARDTYDRILRDILKGDGLIRVSLEMAISNLPRADRAEADTRLDDARKAVMRDRGIA